MIKAIIGTILIAIGAACLFTLLAITFADAAGFTFPSNPSLGQEVTGPGGQIYVWDGTRWVLKPPTPMLPVNNPLFTGVLRGPNLVLGAAEPNLSGEQSILATGMFSRTTSSTIGVGEFPAAGGLRATQSAILHIAPNAGGGELGVFLESGLTPGTIWNGSRNQYLALRGPNTPSGAGLFLENGSLYTYKGGAHISNTVNGDQLVSIFNHDATGVDTRAGLRINAGTENKNLWILANGEHNAGSLPTGGAFIYADGPLRLASGFYPTNSIGFLISNVGLGSFQNGDVVSGLCLGGFAPCGGVHGELKSAMRIGQMYLTSTAWATVQLSGAAFHDPARGWVGDGGNGGGANLFQLSAQSGGAYFSGPGAYGPLQWTSAFRWAGTSMMFKHMGNDDTNAVPYVWGGGGAYLWGGSRDSFGEIAVPHGEQEVAMAFGQPWWGQPVCTFSPDGTHAVWMTYNKNPYDIHLMCRTAGPGGWDYCWGHQLVMYHCASMNG